MSAMYRLGFLVREAGVALDKLGCMLQGNFAFREQRKFFDCYLQRNEIVINAIKEELMIVLALFCSE